MPSTILPGSQNPSALNVRIAKAITALARPSQYVHMSMCSFTTSLLFCSCKWSFRWDARKLALRYFRKLRSVNAKELRKWEKAAGCSPGSDRRYKTGDESPFDHAQNEPQSKARFAALEGSATSGKK